MTSVNDYKTLRVWQCGMDIAEQTYTLAKLLPQTEQYGLRSQIERASISIPSNIAEGRNRSTLKEYVQFLHIALGSLSELETQMLFIQRVYTHIPVDKLLGLILVERKQMFALIKKIRHYEQSRLSLKGQKCKT